MSKREEFTEIRQPDFPGLVIVPDDIGGARIAQNCQLYKQGQLDSRPGLRHANHRRYPGGVTAIIDVQRICDYGKILVCSGWTGDDQEVFEHTEEVSPGYGGPVGSGGYAGDGFWDKGFPPLSVINGVPLSGFAPLHVQFSSAGSYDPDGGSITYQWNFGDGSPIETDPNPDHIYVGRDIYTASLTVTDNEGKTDTAQVLIDTREVVVVATGNVSYSVDGAQTFAASVGIPAGNTNYILANGLDILAFRRNALGNTVDVYLSQDGGANFALLSQIPANGGQHLQAIVGNAGRILVPIVNLANQTACAYSDDDAASWTVAIVDAASAFVPQLVHLGAGVVAAIHQMGPGLAFHTHISNNNGTAWGANNGGFGDSAAVPRPGALNGNRLVVGCDDAAPGVSWEIRTSDDLGMTWQLRDTIPGALALISMGASGLQALTDRNGVAVPRQSLDRGLTWADGFNFAGQAFAFHRRSDGWFAGVGTGVWFSGALPNFVLRGNIGAGIIVSIATIEP